MTSINGLALIRPFTLKQLTRKIDDAAYVAQLAEDGRQRRLEVATLAHLRQVRRCAIAVADLRSASRRSAGSRHTSDTYARSATRPASPDTPRTFELPVHRAV